MTLFQNLIKNNYQNLNLFLIASLIITFPFNLKLLFFFRLNDLFGISLILFNINLLSKKNWLYILSVFFIFTFSNILGFFYAESIFYIKIAFYYKIFVVIFLFFILNKIFEKFDISFLDKIYLLNRYVFNIFILLIIFFQFENYFTHENIFYPNFFISETNDTHILTNIFLTFLVFEIIYNYQKKFAFKDFFDFKNNYFLVLILLMLILKTFSSSVYYYLFFLLFYIFNIILLNNKFVSGKINISESYFNYYFFISLFIIFVFGLYFLKIYFIDESIIHELNFVLDYLYFGNQLDFGWFDVRIYGWVKYFSDLTILNLLFGFGFINSEQIFHDSFLIFLFYSIGLFGTILLFYCTYKIIYKPIFNDLNFIIFLICIIGANLFITEFILISRYSFMVVLMVSIYCIKFHKLSCKKS